jgi:hypothetical protein
MRDKKYILIFLFLLVFVNLFCQHPKYQRWSIGVDAGYTDFTLSDNLLNYYTYKGNSFQYANAQLNYISDSDLFFGNVFYAHSNLQPDISLNTYKYNYLNFIDASLSLEYFHKILTVTDGFNIFMGAAYRAQFTDKRENFKSTLWVYAEGYKECGEVSFANFSLNALLFYQLKNYLVLCKSGYSLLNFTGRANDSFTGLYNKLYSINNYTNYQFSLSCCRRISNRLNMKIEYAVEYEDYKYSLDFRILKKIASLGISYKF